MLRRSTMRIYVRLVNDSSDDLNPLRIYLKSLSHTHLGYILG